MNRKFSRREFLRIGGYAGLGLSGLSMWSCGGSGRGIGGTSSAGSSPGGSPTPVDTGYKERGNVVRFGGKEG